jgi:branched-chain amino acid transport system permease protein
MSIKDSIRQGLIALAILLYLDFIGFPVFFGTSAIPFFALTVGLLSLSYTRRAARSGPSSLSNTLLSSLIIGVISGVGLALVTYFFANLQARGIRVTNVLAQIKSEHTATLTGLTKEEVLNGVSVLPGLLKITVILIIGSFAGGLFNFLSSGRLEAGMESRPVQSIKYWGILALPLIFFALFLIIKFGTTEIFETEMQRGNFGLAILFFFIGAALFAFREAKPGIHKAILSIALVALVLIMPQLTNLFQNAVLGAVAIFIVMGIGLNIVVGFAGLLDLGYVAFFAVGAYTYGLVSAPESYIVLNLPGFEGISFWAGLPLAIFIGAFAGILLGAPVLRMRGDYLAIVTLGFGEIIRLLVLNLRDYTGGPGGVLNIPAPTILGNDLGDPKGILYLAMFFGVVATFLTLRLRDARLGRAWVALREDEDVAQAMGINLISIKLLAFGAGAAFAAAGGALYAARQVNIFPDNFALDVSINVLSLIIIGGIGSFEGVVLGSIALIGLPEILRSVQEYRIIAFGALLVVMMIIRPEGFLPSSRRKYELRAGEEEPIVADAEA